MMTVKQLLNSKIKHKLFYHSYQYRNQNCRWRDKTSK